MAQKAPRLEIVYRPVDSISAHPRNARTHSKKQIAQIVRSYREFGVVNAVLIDENNVVIAGHARLEAAKAMGLTELATIQISHLSDRQKRALMLADNKLALNAGWDMELLAAELKDLSMPDLEFDIEVTGFDMGEFDVVIDGPTESRASDPLDDVNDIDKASPAISQCGDLWTLGQHRLLCGSALEVESYARLLDGEAANMVFTDPPYNVAINGHVSGLGKVKHAEFQMASGEMSEPEFTYFLGVAHKMMARHTVDGGIIFTCMDWRHMRQLLDAVDEAKLKLLNLCVWAKTNGGMGSLYRSQHELVAVLKNGTAPHINNVELGKHGRYRTNVWSYPGANTFRKGRDRDLADHPTVKPVAMIADAIKDCSDRGHTVLDPFGGSGSTLLAAERTGRVARLIELEPRYVDVTIRRWQALTGKQAIHLASGLPFDERRELLAANTTPSNEPPKPIKTEPDPRSVPEIRSRQRSRSPWSTSL